MKLTDVAKHLDCALEWRSGANREAEILDIAPLATAGPADLAAWLDARHQPEAVAARAGAILLGEKESGEGLAAPALLRAAQPQVAWARAIALLRPAARPAPGIHPTACVDATAALGPGAAVGPFAVVGPGCVLGPNAVLHAHAVLYENVTAGANFTAHAHAVVREGTRLGDDVLLQPGVVIGGDGFGFARRRDGGYEKIPQRGGVEIGDGVEIQANSCVDRGTLEATRIGAGTKIDNLSQVAHNCRLGENILLCAQVGLAGSTVIEPEAVLAGQVGVAGHCVIGRGAVITAQSGTHGDLAAGGIYSGSPAFDHRQWLRSTAIFAKLGDLFRSVQQLRAALGGGATESPRAEGAQTDRKATS